MDFNFLPNTQINFQVLEKGMSQTVGFNCIDARRAQKLTAHNVADKLGLNLTTYHSYETGQTKVSMHFVICWSLMMNLSCQFVWRGTHYQGIIPQEQQGKHISTLQPLLTQLSNTEFEAVVRDLCAFTNQAMPSFNEIEQAYQLTGQSSQLKLALLQECEGDLYLCMSENIKRIRKAVNLNQREMADLLQISLHVYRQIENPTRPLKTPAYLLPRWHFATNLSILYLFQHTKCSYYKHYQNLKLKLFCQILSPVPQACYHEVIQYLEAMVQLKHSLVPSLLELSTHPQPA